MDKKYKKNNTTISMINYHFVFCPRYRRKIFSIDGVETCFKKLVHQICEQNGMNILSVECGSDFCHLFVNTPPEIGPADVMRLIKTGTTHKLRNDFKKLEKCPTIWTRNYFVSTEQELSQETIREYVDSQKTKDY